MIRISINSPQLKSTAPPTRSSKHLKRVLARGDEPSDGVCEDSDDDDDGDDGDDVGGGDDGDER